MSRYYNNYNNNYNRNNNGYGDDQDLLQHIRRFIGQTVTIFTTSGGLSGCGFTGVVLDVNCDYVRLVTKQGTGPTNPISEEICDFDDGIGGAGGNGPGGKYDDGIGGAFCGDDGRRRRDRNRDHGRRGHEVGSVCDIPIDKIAAFCHNAV